VGRVEGAEAVSEGPSGTSVGRTPLLVVPEYSVGPWEVELCETDQIMVVLELLVVLGVGVLTLTTAMVVSTTGVSVVVSGSGSGTGSGVEVVVSGTMEVVSATTLEVVCHRGQSVAVGLHWVTVLVMVVVEVMVVVPSI